MFGSCPSREAALETFGKTSFDQLDTSVFKNGGLLDSGSVAQHRNVTGSSGKGIRIIDIIVMWALLSLLMLLMSVQFC